MGNAVSVVPGRSELDDGQVLSFRNNRKRLFWFLLLTLMFVAAGVLMGVTADKPEERLIGWVGTGFFGLGLPIFLWSFFDRRPRLVLDAHGITDRTLKLGLIEWADIVDARLMTIHRNAFVSLDLRNSQKYLVRRKGLAARAGRLNRVMGYSEINVNLANLDGDPMDILRVIEQRRALAAQRAIHQNDDAAQDAPAEPSGMSRQIAETEEFAVRLSLIAPRAYVTWMLIAVNVGVFGWMVSKGINPFSPGATDLLPWGANFGPETTDGQWWRLASSMFLHFGVLHLALNMWALYSIGSLTERLYGTARFAGLYLFAGLTGSLVSLLWNPAVVSAGASGAVFGVYGALIAFLLRPGSHVPASVLRQHLGSTVAFVGYNLFFGLTHPGIDNAAHLGGVAGGAAIGFLLARPFLPEVRRAAGMGSFAVATTAGLLILLGLSWPLTHPSASRTGTMAFHRAMEVFPTREQEAINRFNAVVQKIQAKELNDAVAADRIEKDVLPLWDEMHDLLSRAPPTDAELVAFHAALLRYIDRRREAFRVMTVGLRTQDGERMIEAKEMLEAGRKDLEEVKKTRESGR